MPKVTAVRATFFRWRTHSSEVSLRCSIRDSCPGSGAFWAMWRVRIERPGRTMRGRCIGPLPEVLVTQMGYKDTTAMKLEGLTLETEESGTSVSCSLHGEGDV